MLLMKNVDKTCREMTGRPMTHVRELAREYNFGEPKFGCYFLAQYDPYSDVLAQQLKG